MKISNASYHNTQRINVIGLWYMMKALTYFLNTNIDFRVLPGFGCRILNSNIKFRAPPGPG